MTNGTPVRRQCGPSRGPHSSVSLDRWRARPRGDLHPAWTASPVTKGARRCSRRGSIRRRVEFLFSVPSARANQRSSQGGRHGARLAFSGYGRRASAVRTAPATVQHENPVSGKRPGIPFFIARWMTALSRARAAGVSEDRAFCRVSAHVRSIGRSRTTTSKPERATPRETGALHRPDSGRGRNPRSEPTSGPGSRRPSRELGATHRVRRPERVGGPHHGAARRRVQEPRGPNLDRRKPV